jgi:hypothetical protein
MKFKNKYRLMLYKAYFDRGLGVTNYLKYVIAGAGLVVKQVDTILWIGLIYLIFCFVVGYLWFRWRLVEAEQEVSNNYNILFRKLRRNI